MHLPLLWSDGKNYQGPDFDLYSQSELQQSSVFKIHMYTGYYHLLYVIVSSSVVVLQYQCFLITLLLYKNQETLLVIAGKKHHFLQ